MDLQFISQKDARSSLDRLAAQKKQSILIDGVSGSGKTHLARYYARKLGVDNFQLVDCTVQSIRDSVDAILNLRVPTVLCVENLDSGVAGAAYSLLKFLEEPIADAYVIVTCRNMECVPETIASRSAAVFVSPPLPQDILVYAESKNFAALQTRKDLDLWSCVKSFSDVDSVLSMSADQLDFFTQFLVCNSCTGSVSKLSWDMSHYPDGTEAPIQLVLRCLLHSSLPDACKSSALSCLRDLEMKRLGTHAVISKFCFDVQRYCNAL